MQLVCGCGCGYVIVCCFNCCTFLLLFRFFFFFFFLPSTSLWGFYSEQHASVHYNTFHSLAQTTLHKRATFKYACLMSILYKLLLLAHLNYYVYGCGLHTRKYKDCIDGNSHLLAHARVCSNYTVWRTAVTRRETAHKRAVNSSSTARRMNPRG